MSRVKVKVVHKSVDIPDVNGHYSGTIHDLKADLSSDGVRFLDVKMEGGPRVFVPLDSVLQILVGDQAYQAYTRD